MEQFRDGMLAAAAIATSGGYAQTQKVTYILGGSKNNIQKVFAIAAVLGVISTVGVMFLWIIYKNCHIAHSECLA